MPTQPDEFTETRIIIGEGYEDAIFASQIIRTPARLLPHFDVWANEDLGKIGGNSGFRKSAAAADIKRNFPLVTDVVILADNDEDPQASFASVCSQIRNAKQNGQLKRNWAIPTAPATKQAGDPSVSVWMFPAPGQAGCLETLLWTAIQNQRGNTANVACVEAALRCTGANQWPKSKQDKARVRAFLSLVCRDNPSATFNNLWRDFPDLIPMNQAAFTPVADFLRAI
jgi:hypothetical protein